MRAATGEDDDLDCVVLHGLIEGSIEVVGHLQVLRVARLGPVHHDPRDAWLRPFHDDGLELHGALAFPLSLPAMLLFRQMIRKCHRLQNRPANSVWLGLAAAYRMQPICYVGVRFSLGECDAQTMDGAGDAVVPES